MTDPQRVQSTNANNLELNQGDNFIFLVDVSGSMAATDCPGGLSRIDYLKEKVEQFAGEAAKYDTDGIDVLAFGHQVTQYNGVTGDKAKEVIHQLKANEGATMTHLALNEAYKLHKAGGYEQTVVMIATDGEPSDHNALIKAIADITNDIKDPQEFGIIFLTVGVISSGLRSFLNTLDDALPGAKYDIVDVKTLEEVDFMSAFIGALND